MSPYNAIQSFFAKRFYKHPDLLFREGDPQHDPVPDWEPLLNTPGYPGYPGFGACYAGFSESYLAK